MSKTNPCCPKFDPSRYVNKELTLDGKLFVQDTVYSLFYIPITFGRVTNRVLTKLVDNQADPLPEEVMTLQQVYPCLVFASLFPCHKRRSKALLRPTYLANSLPECTRDRTLTLENGSRISKKLSRKTKVTIRNRSWRFIPIAPVASNTMVKITLS